MTERELRFGIIATLLPAADLVKVGVAAEKLGFDSVWVPDHYVDAPPSGDRFDPWVILSAIAALTNRIMLSTAATDVLRYHPSKLAHILATLDELSGGRAMAGLGSGEAINVVPFGIAWEKKGDRTQRLRETIDVMRLLWTSSRSHPAKYSGRFYRLDNAWLDTPPLQKPYPSIFVAASSKNSLSLAGEIGDGWLSGYGTFDGFRERVEIVRSSAIAERKDPNTIRVALWFCAALSENEETLTMARKAIAPEILLYVGKDSLKRQGFEILEEQTQPNATHFRLSADEETASWAAHASSEMSDEVIEEFVPCCNAARMIEVIDQYRKNGATDIVLRDVVGQLVRKSAEGAIDALRDFSEKVIPYFRETQS